MAPTRTGRMALGLGGDRDGLLYVPRDADPGVPSPLVVLFHGAGAEGAQMVDLFAPLAEAHGAILVAPDARGRTWDLLEGELGPDLERLETALAGVGARWAIDPRRLALGGFSDGASYALTLGLGNGERFSTVLAFSPGFSAAGEPRGRPRVFVSHGLHDRVLAVELCSRRIKQQLERAGYAFAYHEFEGEHCVPEAMGRAAFTWWLGGD